MLDGGNGSRCGGWYKGTLSGNLIDPPFGRFKATAISWQSIQRFTQRLGHRGADLEWKRTMMGVIRVDGVEADLPATDASHHEAGLPLAHQASATDDIENTS